MLFNGLAIDIQTEECSLNQLIDQLLNKYQAAAYKQNSFFKNNIPRNLKMRIDKEGLTILLDSVFHIFANCSRDTCIEVSAGFYLDVILLHIKDISTFNGYAIKSKTQHLQQLAERIGGMLTITSEHPKDTTITLSFSYGMAHPVSLHQIAYLPLKQQNTCSGFHGHA